MTTHLPYDRLTPEEESALEWLEGDCPEPARAHQLYPGFDKEGGFLTVQFVNACLRARAERTKAAAMRITFTETVEMPVAVPPWLRY